MRMLFLVFQAGIIIFTKLLVSWVIILETVIIRYFGSLNV